MVLGWRTVSRWSCGVQASGRAKNYTDEEDMFLVNMMKVHGYGNWDTIRNEIRKVRPWLAGQSPGAAVIHRDRRRSGMTIITIIIFVTKTRKAGRSPRLVRTQSFKRCEEAEYCKGTRLYPDKHC
jgi:hypothetical protein